MTTVTEMGSVAQLLLSAHTITFNFYDVILLITFTQSLLFALIFALHKKSTLAHKVFTVFMATISLGSLNFFLTYYKGSYNTIYNTVSTEIFCVTPFLFYFPGLLLYEFVRTLTYGKFEFEKYHVIPFVMFIAAYIWHPVERYQGLWADIFWRDHVFITMVGFMLSAAFGLLAIWHLKRYSNQLKQQTADVNTIDFAWIKNVAIGFLTVWMLEILAPFMYNQANWYVHHLTTHLKNVGELVLVSYVVFSHLLHSNKIKNIPYPTTDHPSQTDLANPQSEIDSLFNIMQEQKCYRKHNLTIEAFSEVVNLPVREVSQIINQYYEKNFYEFVNEFRINDAKKLLKDPTWRRKSIQLIYEEVGFNSKSSFNTLFKKNVGMTPSHFRKTA
ncbi:helix-turn-helix domain-containing protein [Algibacillus agarilyticus]|uniref:helix-turn-helix domain-containing protein n=1 Tax=Algibacillus agarilyticus TaxID=2234133 RepID=UPI000DD0BCC6|nr:helix-turn-helix domain-containing protein [Algibacillus agarilyticus]